MTGDCFFRAITASNCARSTSIARIKKPRTSRGFLHTQVIDPLADSGGIDHSHYCLSVPPLVLTEPQRR